MIVIDERKCIICSKTWVPAVKPGKVMVVGVGFPQLQIGGELVELKVQVTPEQTMMVTR